MQLNFDYEFNIMNEALKISVQSCKLYKILALVFGREIKLIVGFGLFIGVVHIQKRKENKKTAISDHNSKSVWVTVL